MKNNIIELPAGRIRRDTRILKAKQSRDPDLYVNMVENNPAHVARREARRNAYYNAMQSKREEDEKLLQNVSITAMFATLAALIGFGLGF